MLADNPLLTFLGRRGRGAILEAMRRNPLRTWSVRDLAAFADVDAMTASRAVRELAALGAVESTRPGRDARVRWAEGPGAVWLRSIDAPDLRLGAARAFAAAYVRTAGVRLVLWRDPGDDPASPLVPPRVALVTDGSEEGALDAAGPALDAVRRAGLPAVQVTAFARSALTPGDRTADAILAGVPLA